MIDVHNLFQRYAAYRPLAADTERWYGEQVAKVMRRVLAQGEAWEPLRPRKAWVEEARRVVMVEFAVPRPPLMLDHEWLPRQERALAGGFASLDGFQVRSKAGAVRAISAVKIAAEQALDREDADRLAHSVARNAQR